MLTTLSLRFSTALIIWSLRSKTSTITLHLEPPTHLSSRRDPHADSPFLALDLLRKSSDLNPSYSPRARRYQVVYNESDLAVPQDVAELQCPLQVPAPEVNVATVKLEAHRYNVRFQTGGRGGYPAECLLG